MRCILENGRDEWKKEKGHRMRWKVECPFSYPKRLFMGVLRARIKWNIVQ